MSYKANPICLKFSFVLLFLLFLQLCQAQRIQKNVKTYGTEKFSALDALLLKDQKSLGGNMVAMVWKDTIVYKREIGDLTAQTVTPIANCSQWLTAALVMKFVDEGKISLDDKVSQYIPIFASYNKNYITIRQCLSHMTGIAPESSKLLKLVEKKKFGSLEEQVNEYAKKEIESNPGTDFYYSNIGINIAGRILEIVSRKKFDMLIKTSLFNPLGMRQTTFSTLDGSAPNPANGAQSTANDYLHFLQMLLNNGVYNGQQILSQASVEELRKIQVTPDKMRFTPKAVEGHSYALGSWVLDSRTDNSATSLICPGLFGPWAAIDYCRGAAYVFFVKNISEEQKKDSSTDMKNAADEVLPDKCAK